MTTASSLPFCAMEVPVLDDSMEMASPYQGHADDFDIDLDVMEDQASTTDKDMMGDDDYQDTSYDMGFEPTGANDADMIDDIAEESGMIDADEQFPDVDYNAEIKSYEAEMLEDDYDEDIDAPVPESSGDAALSEHQHTEPILPQEPPVTELVHDQRTVESLPEIQAETLNEDSQNQPKFDQQGNDDEANIGAVEPEADIPRGDHVEETADGTNEAEKPNLEAEHLDQNEDDENYVVVGDAENQNQHTEESHAAEDTEKGADAQQPEVKDHAETNTEDTGQVDEHEPEVDSEGHTSGLYPVKVYYMDNEISLFPPAEGDTSETFFLEDESLAYEPLGKLFSSCREILRDHVGDNEVLIMDVDSLNIQLAEDSMYISKVTLYQIVDLYLRLCHNDGVAEPEPLYLTLSTRLTVAAEVSGLILAASEGKGLSEIHSWDSYPEADADSEDIGAGSDDEHAPVEPHDGNISLEQEGDVEQGSEASAESAHHERTVPDTQADESQPAPEEDGSLEHEDGSGDSDNAEEPADPENNAAETVREPQASKQEDKPDDSQHDQQVDDPSYDSEEQHTESTATITQLPAVGLTEGQQPDEVHSASHDQDVEGESSEHAIVGGDYPDEGLEQNNTEFDDETEFSEHDDSGEAHGNDETEFHEDESYEEFEEGEHVPEQAAASEGHEEDNTENTLLGDDGDAFPAVSKPELGATGSDPAGIDAETAPAVAENSSGIAGDLSKSPPKESSGTEHDESTAIHGHDEPLSAVNESTVNDDHEELIFDDGELLDLGIPEEFDALNQDTSATPIAPASVKRQRDDEDEFELADSPSPDAKRSRSS